MGVLLQLAAMLGVGFAGGLTHALDADHVVAVSTLVGQTKNLRKSSALGAVWGIGHTLTLLFIGFIILALKITIPASFALAFEFFVGAFLVLLGIDVLRQVIRPIKGFSHKEMHKDGVFHHHTHKSFIMGLIHGLAGSAALILLVLTTIDSVLYGLLFILVFGLGSVIGMFIMSTIIGLPFVLATKFEKMYNYVKTIAGITSVILGFVIMYEIGIVKGLFGF